MVSWKTVSTPKKKGGLGIRNLRSKKKALLFKWLWRFPNEQEALWAKVIKTKFGLHSNQWDSRLARRFTFRSLWKFISSLYECVFGHSLFLSLFRMPSGVIKELEKIMRNFLWKGADGDGGDHLVPWKMVVRPKLKGGLGIGRLKERNKASLFKWL